MNTVIRIQSMHNVRVQNHRCCQSVHFARDKLLKRNTQSTLSDELQGSPDHPNRHIEFLRTICDMTFESVTELNTDSQGGLESIRRYLL